MGEEPIRDEVRRRYAAVAVSVRKGGGSSCCGSDVGRVIDSEARGVDWMGGAILRSKSASCRGPLWRLRLGAGTRSPMRRSPRAKWFWTWAVTYGAELAASGCCGGLDLERALSDPIRVRMLGMLAAEAAEGRGCCGLPDLGAPVSGEEDSPGICVCELEESASRWASRGSPTTCASSKRQASCASSGGGDGASTPSTAKPPATSWPTPVSICRCSGRSMNVFMVGVEDILRSGLPDDFAEQLKAGGGGVEWR